MSSSPNPSNELVYIEPPRRDYIIPLSLLDPTLAQFAENCRMIEPTQQTVSAARYLRQNIDQCDRDYILSILSNLVPEIHDEQPLLMDGSPVFLMHIGNEDIGNPERQYDTLAEILMLWEDHSSVHPCIALTVVLNKIRSYISFAGFALGGSIGILTEAFSMASMNIHPTDLNSVKILARHLTALQIAIADFKNRISLKSPSSPVSKVVCPYKKTFMHLGTKRVTTLAYDYFICAGRLLFKGRINPKDDNSAVCIKFTQWYGRNLHEWCERQGWAPKLLGYEKLPNDWIMVIMEYLDIESEWVMFSDVDDKYLVVDEIQNALEKLHENGMVHGDINAFNIMVKRSSMKINIVDFDWAGLKGIAKYPINVGLAVTLGRPTGVFYDADILPEHDMYMWNNLKRQA